LLDGSLAAGSVPVTRFPDNSKLGFGDNSYISESGTGRLIISGGTDVQIKSPGGEMMAEFNGNQGVELYYNNSKKLETTSTGIKISGVSEYADNAAAIAGGLTTGDVYRTGDLLKIVH